MPFYKATVLSYSIKLLNFEYKYQEKLTGHWWYSGEHSCLPRKMTPQLVYTRNNYHLSAHHETQTDNLFMQINNFTCKYIKSHQKPQTHEFINDTRCNSLTLSFKCRNTQRLRCGRHPDPSPGHLSWASSRKIATTKYIYLFPQISAQAQFLLQVTHSLL
jgi:hypothetical protein